MPKTIARNLNLCFTKIKEPQQDHTPPLTLNSNSPFLVNKFNTLYDEQSPSNSKSESDSAAAPDFATVFASQRFFFSSPGRSNSIVESSSSLSSSSLCSPPPPADSKSPGSEILIGGGIPIPTFSPNPYLDFRQSMQEMVESRELVDVRANWNYLHELLMCYLALNPKSTHKFIVGAFADLLLSLMPSPVDGGIR